MPSKHPSDRFNDIIYNIDAIGRYTMGMSEKQFQADEKTFDATQHCLLRISEAAKKLGPVAKELAPEQPWADIRGIGNRLRHEDCLQTGNPTDSQRSGKKAGEDTQETKLKYKAISDLARSLRLPRFRGSKECVRGGARRPRSARAELRTHSLFLEARRCL